MTKYVFHPIKEPNLYGLYAKHEGRAVEVIRCDQWSWTCFSTIDGHVCKRPVEGAVPEFGTKAQAMSWAKSFLDGKITPDVWETKREIGDRNGT